MRQLRRGESADPRRLALLRVVLLAIDGTALAAELVLRFDSFPRGEDAAVHAVTHDRAVDARRVGFKPPGLGAGELSAAHALSDAFLLNDLTVLDGRLLRNRWGRGQEARTESGQEDTCGVLHDVCLNPGPVGELRPDREKVLHY